MQKEINLEEETRNLPHITSDDIDTLTAEVTKELEDKDLYTDKEAGLVNLDTVEKLVYRKAVRISKERMGIRVNG